MYALKPVFDLDAKVDIPSCMYSLPVIQSSTPIAGIGGAKVGYENVISFFISKFRSLVLFPLKL